MPRHRALSSAEERCLHTAEVTGSNPVAPTPFRPPCSCENMAPENSRLGGVPGTDGMSSQGTEQTGSRRLIPSFAYYSACRFGRMIRVEEEVFM